MKKTKKILFLLLFGLFFSLVAQAQCSATATVTESRCAASGSITVSMTPNPAATGSYVYLITSAPATYVINPQPQSSNVFQNLPAGDYTIHITDGGGCATDITATVPGNYVAPGLLQATVTNVYCPGGSSGVITAASPTGGRAPWSFALIAPSPVTTPLQADSVFSGLPVGSYTLQATDSCGTVRTGSFTVAYDTGYIAFNSGIIFVQIGCSDLGLWLPQMVWNNTSVNKPVKVWWVTPAGDTIKGSNTFAPINNVTADTLPGYLNTAGTYTVIVMDTCGRTYTASAYYDGRTRSLTANGFSATCSGYSVGSSLYQYAYGVSALWQVLRCSDSSVYTETTVTGTLANPIYNIPTFPLELQYDSCYILRLIITPCNDTLWSDAFQQSSYTFQPVLSQEPGCIVQGSGQIDVTFPDYQHTIYPFYAKIISGPSNVGDSTSSGGGMMAFFTNLPLGTYTVQVTNTCGDTVLQTITLNQPLVWSETHTITPKCSGGADVHIVIKSNYQETPSTRFNVTLPVNYTPVNVTQTGNPSDSFTVWTGDLLNVDTGYLYIGIVSNNNSNSCNVWDTVYIPPYTLPQIDTVIGFLCNAGSTAFLDITVSGGSQPYQYAIRPSGSDTWGPLQDSTVFSGLTAGNYDVEVLDACPNSNIYSFNLTPLTPIPVVAPRCGTVGQSYTLSSKSVFKNITYEWVYNGTVVYTGGTYTIPSFSDDDTGTYYLRQIVPSSCTGNDSTVVQVQDCALLPVTLASFNAVNSNGAALLKWTTATEINNKGFEIERSTDAQTWSAIGFVNSKAANGNSSISLNYQYTDNSLTGGVNYYRLKQEDLSGGAVYSQVKSVDFVVKATIYPNPVSNQLNVTVAGNSSYQLINAAGSVVLTGSFSTGNNVLNVGGIAAGTYLLRITSGANSTVYKVIKK